VKEESWFFWRGIFVHSADGAGEEVSEEHAMSVDPEYESLLAAETSEMEPLFPIDTEVEPAPPCPEPQVAVAEAQPNASVEAETEPAPEKPPKPVRPQLILTGFKANRSALKAEHLPLLLRVARQIASRGGESRIVRAIRIVGVSSRPSSSARLLAESRAQAVRAALAEAIERVWPGLSAGIEFSTAEKPDYESSSLNSSRALEQLRTVKVYLETSAAERPVPFPAIVHRPDAGFAWNTATSATTSDEQPSDGDASESPLRALSSGGYFYVLSTETPPSRWVCALQITFPAKLSAKDGQCNSGSEPVSLRATGLLISPRHILTAAHCVASRLREFPTTDGVTADTFLEDPVVEANCVVVSPARNGEMRPFGAITLQDPALFRSSARWRASRMSNTESDFALLTLTRPIAIGSWGRSPFLIAPASEKTLSGAVAYSAGYPARRLPEVAVDAPLVARMAASDMQWLTLGTITNVSARSFSHDFPVLPGQDGAPIWTQQGSNRLLVGIVSCGQHAVRVTSHVRDQLRKWMVQDGVRPSF
jgi:hypothetical protein